MNRRPLILLTILFVWTCVICGAQEKSDRPTPSLREGKSNPPSKKSDQNAQAPQSNKTTPEEPVTKPQAQKNESVPSNAPEKPENKTSSDWWIVYLTGALVFVGLGQLGAMGVQTYWMIKTVAVAKASADAATATVKTMQDTAVKQLRAYVYPIAAQRCKDETGVMVIKLQIKNAGQTPAYDCTRYMHEAISNRYPQLPENFVKIPVPARIPKSPIPPGEMVQFYVPATELTSSQEGQIMVKKAA